MKFFSLTTVISSLVGLALSQDVSLATVRRAFNNANVSVIRTVVTARFPNCCHPDLSFIIRFPEMLVLPSIPTCFSKSLSLKRLGLL